MDLHIIMNSFHDGSFVFSAQFVHSKALCMNIKYRGIRLWILPFVEAQYSSVTSLISCVLNEACKTMHISFRKCDRLQSMTIVLRSRGISQKSGAMTVRYSQKKECISFVFYCFENLSIAKTLEPLVPFWWVF